MHQSVPYTLNINNIQFKQCNYLYLLKKDCLYFNYIYKSKNG